jgi:UDP-N-acetyl-D-galactosamine dehydrogenase
MTNANTAPQHKIAIIGLGYVGLPLAVEFGKQFDTLGFDISTTRISELQNGQDRTLETTAEEIAAATRLQFSGDTADLAERNIYIVAVPTPVNNQKRPDFTPLIRASETVARALTRGDIVIYESTVYPGATEEICVPVLESVSGLKFNTDFFCGYSPERINPGDKERRLTTIPKITSGSTPDTAQTVDALYRCIITAGTHLAPSMKVAEAAKVIENTQRDANIALINEFALIFHRLGIDTHDVLAAAGTKWNFLPFKPGLVGGHCIGVDPYYLIQRALTAGYYPDALMACRRINDSMGKEVVSEIIKLMIGRNLPIKGGRVLMLGLSFKENCPDFRNTRVVDLIRELQAFGLSVDVHDPWVSQDDARSECGLELLKALPAPGNYHAVVLAVAHDQYKTLGVQAVRALTSKDGVIYDIKGLYGKDDVDGRL